LDEVPDSIERELILPTPLARVWEALTQPEHLAAWFGTRASVDLRPGGAVTFIWDDPSGTNDTTHGVIEVLEPPRRFAFRWQAPGAVAQTTLVEFTLEEHLSGTRLRVVESGFASFPPKSRRDRRDRNSRGWQRELGDLAAYLAAPLREP
jgi:uncharacterized protein YndB with AHSA1/START domain